jgi:hypothetical protein
MATGSPTRGKPTPKAPQRAWPDWGKRALLESILIVFSVFLALALDGWREDSQTRRRVAEVRRYFVEEIQANRAQLASPGFAPLHRQAAQAWDGLSKLPAPSVADRDKAWAVTPNGLHPFKGRDAVWRSFGSSNLIEHMPSRQVFALAEVYQAQDALDGHNAALLALVRETSGDDEAPAYIRSQSKVVRSTLNDITYAETRLLQLYDQALADLAGTGSKPAS